jgi:hypothetical protein
VFYANDPRSVLGLVTANVESYTLRDHEETIEEDGTMMRVESRMVVSYGVVLILNRVAYWLRAVLSGDEVFRGVSGPAPDEPEKLKMVHDVVEEGGAAFDHMFVHPEGTLRVGVRGLQNLSLTAVQGLEEFCRIIGVDLSLGEVQR